MNGGIADEPLAQSLLRHLAATRGKHDPLGSLARTVVNGEATLVQAVRDPWHGAGLAEAASEGLKVQESLPSEEREAIESGAQRLRDRHANPADPGKLS
ncbi:hypothetical protein [Actinoplanes aureus]|uniref:Uncharacterized protein n=1 Tax=Actinoplanes aureus TaxID=2792083 RepID=A0A931G2W2_9ACTN|nr:hypothetical protein [Actinoplanes aureus]MBG0568182.1 hypothetical protein [Actinoplanes aureus]